LSPSAKGRFYLPPFGKGALIFPSFSITLFVIEQTTYDRMFLSLSKEEKNGTSKKDHQ
jgi:hypothetical protein